MRYGLCIVLYSNRFLLHTCRYDLWRSLLHLSAYQLALASRYTARLALAIGTQDHLINCESRLLYYEPLQCNQPPQYSCIRICTLDRSFHLYAHDSCRTCRGSCASSRKRSSPLLPSPPTKTRSSASLTPRTVRFSALSPYSPYLHLFVSC